MLKKTKMRVPISRNPEEVLNLAAKIYQKHLAEGANSPLKAMEDNDWDVDGPNVAKALSLHAEAEKLKGLMEKAYKERDLYIGNIDATVKASRDVLTGVYRKNMKRMADRGL